MSMILITGGGGFIGTHLAARLIAEGHRVRVLDCRTPEIQQRGGPIPAELLQCVEFLCGDVRNTEDLVPALQGVDIVFHLAAKTAVEESMQMPGEYLSHNAAATGALAGLTRDRVSRVIVASSRAVYGEGVGQCAACGDVVLAPRREAALRQQQWDPSCPHCAGPVSVGACREGTPLRPVSMYGLTKRVQEETTQLLLQDSGTDCTFLRYFNVYGPGEGVAHAGVGIVSIFVRRALEGSTILLYEDGHQVRDFVHVDDVIEANVRALTAPPGIYNIGSGEPVTLRELARAAGNACSMPIRLEQTNQHRWGDVRHTLANTELARAQLGWQPRVKLARGVEQLTNWLGLTIRVS